MSQYAGYHTITGEQNAGFAGCSFEVFHSKDAGWPAVEPGWYWWACFPGCLPDGEASGPFETAEQAYNDAIGE